MFFIGRLGFISITAVGTTLWVRKRQRRVRMKRRGAGKANFGMDITSKYIDSATISIIKSTKNLELFVRTWKPKQMPHALIILVHGFSSHSGQFTEAANHLIEMGFAVVSYDLQAHGRSGSTNGLRGDINKFSDLIQDHEKVINLSTMLFPNLPIFVYAEGIGGTIALLSATKKASKIDGLFLCTPILHSLKDSNIPAYVHRILVALKRFTPDMRISNTELMSNIPDMQISDNKSILNHGDEMMKDAFIVHSPTVRFFFEAQKAASKLDRNLDRIRASLLILEGTMDPSITKEKNKLFQKFGRCNDKQLVYCNYPDNLYLHHSSPNYFELLNYIVSWLYERIPEIPSKHKIKKNTYSDISDIPSSSTLRKKRHNFNYSCCTTILDILENNGF